MEKIFGVLCKEISMFRIICLTLMSLLFYFFCCEEMKFLFLNRLPEVFHIYTFTITSICIKLGEVSGYILCGVMAVRAIFIFWWEMDIFPKLWIFSRFFIRIMMICGNVVVLCSLWMIFLYNDTQLWQQISSFNDYATVWIPVVLGIGILLFFDDNCQSKSSTVQG